MVSWSFFAAAGACAVSLAIAIVLWLMSRSVKDWTSPRVSRTEIWSRIFLAIAAFAGICAASLYGWTYLAVV